MKSKKLILIAVLMIGVLALAACDDAEVDDAMYVDGTYTGTGEGYGGEIEVEVTIEDDVISDVEVVSHSETEDLGDDAMDEIIDQVIGEQDTSEVEVVSGATASSNGIIDAINEALALALSPGDAP